ncbi:MAG: translation initiation factor IF-2, partial [Candidatus Gracilibacteria bacterium]
MPDKKVVDDYYSQIDSSGDRGDSNGKGKKPKIVVKKKIIVKKAKIIPKNEGVISSGEKKDYGNKNINKKNISKNNSPKSKGFVQKIEVIKRDNVKRDNVKKDNVRRDNAPKKFTIIKRDNTPKKFTIVKKGDPNYVDRSKRTSGESGTIGGVKFKLRNTGSDDQTKRFGANKYKGSNTSYNKDAKKSKLAGGDRRTRGRFKFHTKKDITFVRSNKVNKKEEKNVEDIKQNLVERKGETVVVPEILSLKELSEKIGITLPMLMAEFMKNGMMVNINSKIDYDSASIVAEAFDVKLEKSSSSGASVEDIMSGNISDFLEEDDKTKLKPRSPVVSIMGHVDHGKTSLLDHIRKAKVASGEAGGITQSIGAYQVELDSGKITFLDTPGHEAFTVMRARGAKLTDIAILVVAADEGVKPQTIESINHAKEAGIPVIVAINKMDKEGANPDHVKGQLAEHGLTPEDWGGDTPMVPVSAISGFGIDDLLEIILLVAEMKELKANPDRAGIATIVESHLDRKLGPVATVLVNAGTIHIGDNIVCQDSYGKIKILKNYNNIGVKLVTPGEPALIVGLDKVVDGGSFLQAVKSVELAKHKTEEYKTLIQKQKELGATGLALLMSKIKAGNLKQLKIILKANTNGALEAIRGALLKLSTPETTVQVIHAGVGSITESDILMGQGS